MTMHKIVRVPVMVCFMLSAMAVQTAPVKWEISGLTFADGGSGSGHFVFDADTEAVSDWGVDVAGGTTTDLPAIQYNVNNSTTFVGVVANYSDEIQISFRIGSDSDQAARRQLRITPVSALTNSGGSIAIDTQTGAGGSGGVECIDCSPFRLITGGTLRSDLDNDGVVDAQDDFPNDPTETTDSDGDGVGDNADAFPNDPTRSALPAMPVPLMPAVVLLLLAGLLGLLGIRRLKL